MGQGEGGRNFTQRVQTYKTRVAHWEKKYYSCLKTPNRGERSGRDELIFYGVVIHSSEMIYRR